MFMNLDNTSLSSIISGIKEGKLTFLHYVISLGLLLIFFALKDFILVKKDDLQRERKKRISDFCMEIVASWGLCLVSLVMTYNMIISVIFGILGSFSLLPKLLEKTKKRKNDDTESITSESNNTNTNNINVVVNNNVEIDGEEEDLLPDFYDPKNLSLPENITSLEQLNIIMILEMYGYISPNHKFKMITQSLFETPDEQVEKLLKMFVLDKNELDEARAILNLIKLNNRLITKEEALHCIVEIKNKEKKGGNKE